MTTNHNVAVVQVVGSVFCSVWAFVFSINVLSLIFDYRIFAGGAADIINRSGTILKSNRPNERIASQLMHDYQTAQCMAPLIPTFIWKLHRDHLNQHWAEFSK